MSSEYLIGIDLGGTNCRLALVDAAGNTLARRRFPTREAAQKQQLIGRLAVACRELEEDGLGASGRLVAVGAGVPGLLDERGTVRVSPNLPFLDGFNFASELEEELGLPVTAVNDANAIAWGEGAWGAAREFSSFLAITLGTGVGGGLILGGELWAGADGAAGEFGHIMVEPEGLPCGCGSRGCVEQYASATGIRKAVQKALAQGRESELAGLDDEALSSERIGNAARAGDVLARQVLRQAGQRLAQALAGTINLLNLEAAVVCGGVSSSFDLMCGALWDELHQRAFATCAERLKIVTGELGDEAGVLGAAHFARQKLIKSAVGGRS